jgi:hypothetical protein
MTPAEEPAGPNIVESPADQPSDDEPDEPRPSLPKLRWGRRGQGKASRLHLRLHERPKMGDTTGDDSSLSPSDPAEEKWKHRASLSAIAGTVAVVIYMIVVTPALLTPTDGGNPFFLILGAIVLFFLAEMLVNGLADLAVWLARWLGPSTERAVNASPEPGQAPPEAQAPPANATGAPTSRCAAGEAGR